VLVGPSGFISGGDYDAFRMLLIAPGHGSPETGGQKAKAN